MNEGVKILIDRMESNPEDFEDRDFEPNTGKITRGKFRSIADLLRKRLSGESPAWDAMNVLTTEEIEALTAAYVEMERKKFTNGVMAKLLEEDKLDSYAYTAGPFQTAMTLGSNGNLGIGTTSGFSGTSGLTINNTATNKSFFKVTTVGTPTMELGSSKLTEDDVKTMSEMISKWRGEDDGTI
jgi:hypothetical protein